MSLPTRTIRSLQELKSLSALPLMQPRPRGAIRIEAAGLAEQQHAVWEDQLDRAYNACGCGEASMGTLVGLIVAGLWLALVGAGEAGFDWADAGVLFIGLVVGTAIGKFFGLMRAQSRLQRLVAEISMKWPLTG